MKNPHMDDLGLPHDFEHRHIFRRENMMSPTSPTHGRIIVASKGHLDSSVAWNQPFLTINWCENRFVNGHFDNMFKPSGKTPYWLKQRCNKKQQIRVRILVLVNWRSRSTIRWWRDPLWYSMLLGQALFVCCLVHPPAIIATIFNGDFRILKSG